jgi:hypothetical protein
MTTTEKSYIVIASIVCASVIFQTMTHEPDWVTAIWLVVGSLVIFVQGWLFGGAKQLHPNVSPVHSVSQPKREEP